MSDVSEAAPINEAASNASEANLSVGLKPGVSRANFGKTDEGAPVEIYTMTNKNGVVAKVMTYGATLTELHVPDKAGKLGDVVLGFDNFEAQTTLPIGSYSRTTPSASWHAR